MGAATTGSSAALSCKRRSMISLCSTMSSAMSSATSSMPASSTSYGPPPAIPTCPGDNDNVYMAASGHLYEVECASAATTPTPTPTPMPMSTRPWGCRAGGSMAARGVLPSRPRRLCPAVLGRRQTAAGTGTFVDCINVLDALGCRGCSGCRHGPVLHLQLRHRAHELRLCRRHARHETTTACPRGGSRAVGQRHRHRHRHAGVHLHGRGRGGGLRGTTSTMVNVSSAFTASLNAPTVGQRHLRRRRRRPESGYSGPGQRRC